MQGELRNEENQQQSIRVNDKDAEKEIEEDKYDVNDESSIRFFALVPPPPRLSFFLSSVLLRDR